jgi:Protein of unknown function (DUF3014)
VQTQTLKEERPYIRPFRSTPRWSLIVGVMMVVAAAGYYYYALHSVLERREPPSVASPPPPAAAPPSAPAPARAPSVIPPEASAPSLPTLENSDSLARETLSRLMGRESFTQLVIPAALVRRIVATVDNLPRETAPRRVVPLVPVPGAFAASATGERLAIAPANFDRYTPYVRVLEAIDSRSLVRDYVRAYPLFQRAHQELGYPGQRFNDRLLAAIDDLIAAPEPATPPELVQPRVRYEFADPDLEMLSAGQKIMVRMGPANAARVKAKLSQIRREILAASAAR